MPHHWANFGHQWLPVVYYEVSRNHVIVGSIIVDFKCTDFKLLV